MDDSVLIVLDYDNICRLCLQTRGALSDIFESEDEPNPLHVQIAEITDIFISRKDNLPKKICHKCRYIVEICYDLRNTVLQSNKLLCESVEANDLMDEVAQAMKINASNVDLCSNDNLTELIHQSVETEETLLNNEINSSKKSKRKDEKIEFFRDVGPSNTVDRKIEDKTMSVETNVKSIKLEFDKKQYISSKDVVLDPVRIEPNESTDINLLPELSDDAGSDGTGKQKDVSGNERHFKQHTCQLCLEVFFNRPALLSHIAGHYNSTNLTPYISMVKPFMCQECNFNFPNKIDLIIHHREHLNINPYMCKVAGCNYNIPSKDAFRHHMYTHAIKKFACNQCGAKYMRKIELMRHKVRHVDEGSQFRCGLCFVICKNRLSLKGHLKNHENGRRFKCDFPGCPKAFFSKSDLKIHTRSHLNDRCFKCPLCVCSYTSRSQLNRHLKRHEKPGPTKCDKCSEVFDDFGAFCNHRIATHGEWQPYRCRGCNQGYQSELQLQKHLDRCKIAMEMKSISNESLIISIDNVEESNDFNDSLTCGIPVIKNVYSKLE